MNLFKFLEPNILKFYDADTKELKDLKVKENNKNGSKIVKNESRG